LVAVILLLLTRRGSPRLANPDAAPDRRDGLSADDRSAGARRVRGAFSRVGAGGVAKEGRTREDQMRPQVGVR
jgi:hypothetical protein